MRIPIVFLLVKAFLQGVKPLQTYFSRLSVSDQAKKGRGRVLQVVLAALMLFSFTILVAMLGFNYYSYQTLGSLIGIPYLGMFLGALAGFSFIFLLASIGLSSIIYRGKDITLASTLPVSERELLVSRLLIAYILYCPIYAGIVLPAIVVAAFVEGVNALFVVGALALLLLGPLLPLSLALLVATALVRLSKGRRTKMVEQLFSFVFILGFSLVMITLFSRNAGEDSLFQVDYQAMMLSMETTFKTMTRLFPLFVLQGRLLWSLPAFLANSLVLLGFPLAISACVGRGYDRSLSLVFSSHSVTRTKRNQSSHNSCKPRSTTLTLMVRDLEVIKSQSVFMIELVGELLIPLILLGVYALTGVLGELEGMAFLVASSPYLPYGLFLGVALISSISMLSSTSVSRQGPQFALDKALPLKAGGFVRAKILLHLGLVGSANVLYLVVSLLFFSISLSHLLWMVPLTLLVVFSNAAFGLAIDYRRPLLTWNIPQQAMKSNMNGLLGMGVSIVVIIAVGIVLFVPMFFVSSAAVGIGLSFLVASGFSLLSWKVCTRQARAALSR
ncbi:MAG TPA: hypothetical protein VJ854_04420 [Sphaerochaeta sp.]|nr:hypothetical protein [Sphaerochaeta sp.]